MKRFTALLLAAFLLLSLAACGGSDGRTADPKTLADDMLAALKAQGETMEVTGDTAENYYAMGDMVKDYRIYLSTMYIGEEVAVFRLGGQEGRRCEGHVPAAHPGPEGQL